MSLDLPDLWNAELDLQGLADLLDAIEARAELIEVRTKGAPTTHSGEYAATGASPRERFREARRLLEASEIRGMQVLYRHQGRAFADTFLRNGDRIRVVRMEATREPTN